MQIVSGWMHRCVLCGQHPSMAVVKGAGLVMKAIIEEGDAEISAKMQELALAEGALPRHLHTAMFTQSTDARMLTVRYHHYRGCWGLGLLFPSFHFRPLFFSK